MRLRRGEASKYEERSKAATSPAGVGVGPARGSHENAFRRKEATPERRRRVGLETSLPVKYDERSVGSTADARRRVGTDEHQGE